MKLLSAGLAAHLASGVTTLCWCWRLTRLDGRRIGFTDHDRDLVFDGTSFEASAGFTASELRDAVGLSVDNLEVEGALSSSRLEERDILAGLYDDAAVEIFRVNWSDPAQRVLMRAGSLGEVRRNGASFSAEVRGLAHYLQQPRGRLYQYTCDADVGDARCGVDLSSAPFRSSAAITAIVTPRRFDVAGLQPYAPDWFTRGLLAFAEGANAGRAFEIKRHEQTSSGGVVLELWQEPVLGVAIGDLITVTAGCDKHPGTCAAKFSNVANYRGFPHMPGNDVITSVARSGRGRASS